MRTTVRLPDDLMRAVKRLATDTDRTMTQVLEDALREVVARARREAKPQEKFSMPTYRGTGIRPGVDLEDSAALLDLMEDPDRFR